MIGKQSGCLTHQAQFEHGLSLTPAIHWALCEDRLGEPQQSDYSEAY